MYSSLFPDSEKSDEYKLLIIKAYYKYAELSILDKQEERFDKVVTEAIDFKQRFPESKYAQEANNYKTLSENYIKNIKNEQAKTADQR